MSGMITWRELIDLLGEEQDVMFDDRVWRAKPASVDRHPWSNIRFRINQTGAWLDALRTLEAEGRVRVDETTDAFYFATAEVVLEHDPGITVPHVHLVCAHEPGRPILKQVEGAFLANGIDFVAMREQRDAPPDLAPGVSIREVTQVMADIATTSRCMDERVAHVLVSTAANGRPREVEYLNRMVGHRMDERDLRLFDLLLTWADPIGTIRTFAPRRGHRRNVASSYVTEPRHLGASTVAEASATLRAVARSAARRRLRTWLAGIGTSPALADGPDDDRGEAMGWD